MNAKEFYELKIRKARNFGFPDPIFLNTEQLTNKNRVIYLAEIQAMHIPDGKGKTHHFTLKFSKFKKIKVEPYWEEENLITERGFTILDKTSIEKLAAYIKANQSLLKIDILSKEFTSALLTNDKATIEILEHILASKLNKEIIFEVFKKHYPKLDEKILTHKLVEKRKVSLEKFKESLPDTNKNERNYWQAFLEKNNWMFGLSYVVKLDETRIDINNTSDYLFRSDDGFVDIVEIKHPHYAFLHQDRPGEYSEYRGCLQISNELRGSISQATNYIFQLEKKISDIDWQRANNCDAPVKPTCTVIMGRSNTWKIKEKTAFRLLNDSLHGIKVITFDHLYDRAERLLKILSEKI